MKVLTYKKIIEARYPEGFNMDTLKQLGSFREKIMYISTFLEKEGTGSSRVVFRVDDSTVLKVARNQAGLSQNKAESNPGLQKYSIVAKVLDTDHGGVFLEMEKADQVTSSIFEDVLFPMRSFFAYLFNKQADRSKEYGYREPIPSNIENYFNRHPWVQEFLDLAFTYDYDIPADFVKYNSYGLVKRNGRPFIVLIDYGFNRETYNNHYKSSTGKEEGDF